MGQREDAAFPAVSLSGGLGLVEGVVGCLLPLNPFSKGFPSTVGDQGVSVVSSSYAFAPQGQQPPLQWLCCLQPDIGCDSLILYLNTAGHKGREKVSQMTFDFQSQYYQHIRFGKIDRFLD